MELEYSRDESRARAAVPEMSPAGMLPRKEPPLPTPSHGGTTTNNNDGGGGANQFYLFDNIPNGISASDGESSTFSLPNVPSPMSAPSPSIADLQPTSAQYAGNIHRHAPNNNHDNRRARSNRNEEEDTFYDDRSLEQRIQRTLQNAPHTMQKMQTQMQTQHQQQNYNTSNYMDTPSSVPITPTGPSRGGRGHSQSQSYWKHATPASSSLRTRSRQKQHQQSTPPPSHRTPPATLYEHTHASNHVLDDDYDTEDHYENTNISNNDNRNDNNNDNLMSHRASMAILKLKTDLRNAVHQNYLIQQEKETAESKVRDLKRNYELCLQEKQAAEERATSNDQTLEAVEQAKQQLTHDVQAAVKELEKATTNQQQRETEVEQLKQEVAGLQKENQDLSTRMRSLIKEHQEDLTTFNDSTEGRLSRMRQELDAALLDNKTLRTSLEDAQKQASEKTTALEEEKAKSEADLIEMTEKHDACIQEMEKFETVVQSAKKHSEDRIGALENQQQDFRKKQEKDQIEIIRLRNALKEASKETGKASASNLKAESEVLSLQEENEALQGSVDEMKVALQDANQRVQTQAQELRVTKDELKAAQTNTETNLAEIQRLASELEGEMQTAGEVAETPVYANKTHTNRASDISQSQANHDVGDSILDRLARIRDAAERASLVKDHHREIARLRDQYEAKIKSLSTRLQQRMEDSMSSVKTELLAKHSVNVEALQSHWEARLATLEKRHQEEIEMVRSVELTRSETRISFAVTYFLN